MSEKLYLECASGISGDMTVAALLDLGADERVLRKALDSLKISGFEIRIGRVKKAGLDVCDFAVILNSANENHDHDMEYLHGHSQEHFHKTHGGEPQKHHEHRGLVEILEIIDCADMTEGARQLAKKIFEIIAEAEAKAHGVSREEVHFHEVGAIDSIVDVISAAVCIDNLGIRDVIVPVLYEGSGSVRCQHGILPVPVPATANIVERYHLKLHLMDIRGEFVTPTGAAIAAAIKTEDELPKHFSIIKTGMGAGKREYEKASILRAMLIDTEEKNEDLIYKLESNVDDCTGENLGYLMERLFEAGARDVSYTPVFMKKNRPAYELHLLCTKEYVSLMEKILFEESTTIGVRKIAMQRSVLKREIKEIQTEYGILRVKICETERGMRYYPEYEDVAKMARENHLPFPELYRRLSAGILEEEKR